MLNDFCKKLHSLHWPCIVRTEFCVIVQTRFLWATQSLHHSLVHIFWDIWEGPCLDIIIPWLLQSPWTQLAASIGFIESYSKLSHLQTWVIYSASTVTRCPQKCTSKYITQEYSITGCGNTGKNVRFFLGRSSSFWTAFDALHDDIVCSSG